MNLRAIASSVVSVVNPPVAAAWAVATPGVTIGPGRKPIPNPPVNVPVMVDIQPLGSQDLRKLESLNITGVDRVFYLNGQAHGVDRLPGLGGDTFMIVDAAHPLFGTRWLVTAVLEAWDANGWTKVGVTKQIA